MSPRHIDFLAFFPSPRALTQAAGLAVVMAAGLLAPQARGAEDSQTTQATGPDEVLDEVAIVGSRIRHKVSDTPAPVTIVTRDEVTSAGFTTTAEVLQSSSLSSGTGQINNAYGGYVTDGGPGANTLALRGLGATRTLILINGRRIAPAGTRGAVGSADLNVLPNALVDRIEILKDGASSIYGSDAVAGVVNVITRNKVSGLTLEGQYNRPFEEGGEQARASAVLGATGDRWSFSGSAEYYERGELALSQRSWGRCGEDYYHDPETGESWDDFDPLTGKPKCYPVTDTGSNGVTINTLGTPSRSGVPAINIGGTSFNRWRPNSGVTTGLRGYEGVGYSGASLNVRDTFEPRMLNESIISPTQNWTGFLQGGYDLQALGNAELYSELLYANRKSQQTGYRQLSLDYPQGSIQIPTGLAADLAGRPAFLPASTPTSPAPNSTDLPVAVRAFIGFGNDHSSQDLAFYKPTFGIRGDLPFADWRYDAYTTYSKSDADYTFESFLKNKLINASHVIATPTGLDPALDFNGVTCAINVSNPAEACVPYPVVNTQTLGGMLPQNFKNYIFRPITGNTTYSEWMTSAYIDGPLTTLPYGKLQAVFGVEHRRARINDTPDANSIAGNLFNLTSASPTRGKDNVTEVFAELEAPLLADLPFAKQLTANASYRYTDYASYGSDKTWKVGLIYSPVKWVSLRGTAGTSYRAPALYEQYQGATSGFLSQSNDPCDSYGSKPPTSATYLNCNAVIGDPTFTSTSGVKTLDEGGAAAGLSAETSDNLTTGIVLEPELARLGSLSVAVDFFDIKVKNEVSQFGATNILSLCYGDASFNPNGGYCNLVDRDPAAPHALTVHDTFVNVATQVSRGFDFTVRYEKDIGPGTLRVNGDATKFRKQASKLFSTDTLDDYNGTIGSPKWSGELTTTWIQGRWQVRYGVDFVGKMDDNTYAAGQYVAAGFFDTLQDAQDYLALYKWTTGTYLTHFGSVRYKDKGWEITAGVRNIFDKQPPIISSGWDNRIGTAPLYSGFDYVGRTAFLRVAKGSRDDFSVREPGGLVTIKGSRIRRGP